jgi:hypothetical protein
MHIKEAYRFWFVWARNRETGPPQAPVFADVILPLQWARMVQMRAGAATAALLLLTVVLLQHQISSAPSGEPVPIWRIQQLSVDAGRGLQQLQPSSPSPAVVPDLLHAAKRNEQHSAVLLRSVASLIRPNGTCSFSSCPVTPDAVYLYTMTSHRNRGASLQRMIKSLLADVSSAGSRIDPGCVCVGIADYGDDPWGPPAKLALESWPFDYHLLHMRGPFSRAGGLQALMNTMIRTPHERSIVYFLDADMVAYPGMVSECVLSNLIVGENAYAPICWSTTGKGDEYQGAWRSTGAGMIAFYMSDFMLITNGSLPDANKLSYGQEDINLIELLHTARRGYYVKRRCCPSLWHLYHTKAHWSDSFDGMLRKKAALSNIASGESVEWMPSMPWQLPAPPLRGAEQLQEQGQTKAYRCLRALSGKLVF